VRGRLNNAELDAIAAAASGHARDERAVPPAGPVIPEGLEIQVEIHGLQQVVEFKSRRPLEIHPTSTFIPFQMIDVVFYTILGARLAPVLAALSPAARAPAPAPDPGLEASRLAAAETRYRSHTGTSP